MESYEQLLDSIYLIEERLSYSFQDRSLIALAFVHRSFVNENREGVQEHNERLEFLGDAVLGLLVSEYLYRYLPDTAEGDLSHLRSRLVEAGTCLCYVQKLEVEEFLLLGKGEQKNAGKGRVSILADLFEAIIGAIYLDGGTQAAKRFLFGHFSPEIQAVIQEPVRNFKAELQDFSQKKYQKPPLYKIVEESGPDHKKRFRVEVYVGGVALGEGEGASKKEAQQRAAESAMEQVDREG